MHLLLFNNNNDLVILITILDFLICKNFNCSPFTKKILHIHFRFYSINLSMDPIKSDCLCCLLE